MAIYRPADSLFNVNNKLHIWYTRAKDRIMDLKLGVHTRGLLKVSNEDYMTLPYKDIMQILHYIHLKPTDVFIDIGCGKGRMLCCAATFNVKKAIGIEHAPEMSFAAMENAYMLREKKSPIEIYIADAAKFDYEEGTIFYMYNLFNQAIMKNVLERIYESLKRRKRLIKIIYTNPLYEHSLYDCSWLTMYDRWVPGILDSPEDKYNDSAGYKSVEVPVSFWKTKL